MSNMFIHREFLPAWQLVLPNPLHSQSLVSWNVPEKCKIYSQDFNITPKKTHGMLRLIIKHTLQSK